MGIQVGDRVMFDPMGYITCDAAERTSVVGTVTFVHEKHRWFLVEHGEIRMGFLFVDLGKMVKPVGRRRK